MRKIIAFLLAIFCLLSVLCVSAVADTDSNRDPLADKFQEVLDPLDISPFDYNPDYMLLYASYHFLEGHEGVDFVTVPAAEYEAFLHAHFYITDETIDEIRNYFEDAYGPVDKFYDETANAYNVWAFGGMGIGMSSREYSHYIQIGDYYEVFYSDINYVYLFEVLPEGTNVGDFLLSLGYNDENNYPRMLEYNGILFTYDFMEGYYAILPEKLERGMKYVVELNDDVVRVISMEPYNNERDPLELKLREALDLVDGYYGYDEHYMVMFANDYFFEKHEGEYEHVITVSAEEYEAVLHRYFYIDDTTMYNIIHLFDNEHQTFYDEATKTYSLWIFGGLSFDGLTSRGYSHYVKNEDNTYTVYYSAITYEFLSDALPEGMDEYAYLESLGYSDPMDGPMSLEYNGVTYLWEMGGYYRVISYDNNYGKKYTVELNDEIVRIISCEDYNDEQPEETTPETEPVTEPVAEPVTEPVTTPETQPVTTPETRVETHFVTLPLESGSHETVASTLHIAVVQKGCRSYIGGGFAVIAILTLGGIMIAKKRD